LTQDKTQSNREKDGANDKGQNVSFSERYVIQYSLGEGGMGVVYKAYDKLLAKVVAIKQVKRSGAGDDAIVRFQKEAKVCARLEHKNILTALDFGITNDGNPYLVLDYVDGQNLSEVLFERKHLPLKEALPIALQICNGVSFAHRKSVLHRDLKPSNIMLTENAEGQLVVKIMDFGIAKVFGAGGETIGQRVTPTGDPIGSPLYMSPEQARGESVDERSDIYSFGCILFELLTGHAPIIGSTSLETVQKKQYEDAPLLSEIGAAEEYSTQLSELIAKCLSRDKANRPTSFQELAESLLAILDSSISDLEEHEKEAIKSDVHVEKVTGKKWPTIVVLITLAATAAFVVIFANRLKIAEKPKAPKLMTGGLELQLKPNVALDVDGNKHPYLRIKNNSVYAEEATINDEWLKKIYPTQFPKSYRSIKLNKCTFHISICSVLPPALEGFAVENSDISDKELIGLSKLRHLKDIFLSSNKPGITFETIKTLKNMPHLIVLELYQPTITDRDIEECSSIKGLCKIGLQGKGFSSKSLAMLRKLPRLEEFVYGDILDEEATLGVLATFPTLKKIEIRNPEKGILQRNLIKLAELKPLRFLAFSETSISGDDLKDIDKLPYLEEVMFHRVSLDDKSIHYLARAKSLIKIELKDYGRLSTDQVIALALLPNLKKMKLNMDMDAISGIAEAVKKANPKLEIESQ
jgi:hypothetical protein